AGCDLAVEPDGLPCVHIKPRAAACALGIEISSPIGAFGAPLTREQTSASPLFSQCFTTTIMFPGQVYGTFNCKGGGCCALTARAVITIPNSMAGAEWIFISSSLQKLLAADHQLLTAKFAKDSQSAQRKTGCPVLHAE